VVDTACYPGVVDTLHAMPRHLRLAVATNKPGEWARRIVSATRIADAFEWVIGGDEVRARKPDPAIIHDLCQRADMPVQRVLYVGDSAIDLETAEAAEVSVVMCTYGYGEATTMDAVREKLRQTGAAGAQRHYLIDSFSQLLPIVAG
jgi:phosphoglycolate phosphatase